jgi:hypothetical protein
LWKQPEAPDLFLKALSFTSLSALLVFSNYLPDVRADDQIVKNSPGAHCEVGALRSAGPEAALEYAADSLTGKPAAGSRSHLERRRAKERSVQASWSYVGNKESFKFHLCDCEFARIMARCRRVGFSSRSQALEAGMKPCNWCQPQWWTRVEARIIYPDSSTNSQPDSGAAAQAF